MRLSAPGSAVVTVNYAAVNGTATNTLDYAAQSGTLTFAPGETAKTVRMAILNDTTAEPAQNFFISLSSPVNASIARAAAIATIIDNDAPSGTPMVSINDFVVDEADKQASFVVTLDRPSTGVVSMNYATPNGSALAGSDYAAASGTLHFAPGRDRQDRKVGLINDTVAEGIESFNLALSADRARPCWMRRALPDLGERPDRGGGPRISVDDVTVDESQTYAEFLVRLSAPGSAVVTVNDAAANGTAADTARLRCASGTLTFAPGETAKTVRMAILNDTAAEPAQNFFISLSSAVNASIARAAAIATIIDNDAPSGTPVVSINDFVVDEADKQASFVVTLDRPSTGVVSMNYATQNGSALAGSDYTAASGALHFAPGETAKTVKVGLINDTTAETAEAFNLALSGLVGGTVIDAVGTAVIAQNDSAVAAVTGISIDDVVVGESETYAGFLVHLTAPSASVVTVNYAAFNGTATNTLDYAAQSGTLTFAPGETVKTVSLSVLNDTTVESREIFGLSLSSPSVNATIERGAGIATIIDNDAPSGTPVATFNDAVVDEKAGLAHVAVTFDKPSVANAAVNYALQSITAASGSDFTVFPASRLGFAAGDTAKTIDVGVVDDTTAESTELFDVVSTGVSGATLGDGRAHVFVYGNDAPAVATPTITMASVAAVESDGYVDILITLSAPGSAAVGVNYALTNSTATEYVGLPGPERSPDLHARRDGESGAHRTDQRRDGRVDRELQHHAVEPHQRDAGKCDRSGHDHRRRRRSARTGDHRRLGRRRHSARHQVRRRAQRRRRQRRAVRRSRHRHDERRRGQRPVSGGRRRRHRERGGQRGHRHGGELHRQLHADGQRREPAVGRGGVERHRQHAQQRDHRQRQQQRARRGRGCRHAESVAWATTPTWWTTPATW